eukprot:363835-Chlamydomonas_euryale.AAC.7
MPPSASSPLSGKRSGTAARRCPPYLAFQPSAKAKAESNDKRHTTIYHSHAWCRASVTSALHGDAAGVDHQVWRAVCAVYTYGRRISGNFAYRIYRIYGQWPSSNTMRALSVKDSGQAATPCERYIRAN